MIDAIERVAAARKAPMLLVGPTGAGKSFLASRVYALKQQRQRLERALRSKSNCATLPAIRTCRRVRPLKGAFTARKASARPA